MNIKEKLATIYKEMANKELTLGCKVKIKYDNISYGETLEEIRNPVEEILTVSLGGVARKDNIEIEKYQILSADSNGYIEDIDTYIEIIGHPVMIGDVLNWIDNEMGVSNCEDEEFVIEEANISVLLWREYLKPIEGQSDECIDYVYNLIQKN